MFALRGEGTAQPDLGELMRNLVTPRSYKTVNLTFISAVTIRLYSGDIVTINKPQVMFVKQDGTFTIRAERKQETGFFGFDDRVVGIVRSDGEVLGGNSYFLTMAEYAIFRDLDSEF